MYIHVRAYNSRVHRIALTARKHESPVVPENFRLLGLDVQSRGDVTTGWMVVTCLPVNGSSLVVLQVASGVVYTAIHGSWSGGPKYGSRQTWSTAELTMIIAVAARRESVPRSRAEGSASLPGTGTFAAGPTTRMEGI
jgi:hypothetical protein